MCMHKVINKYLNRQGEYLNEIGAVYENIYGIDQWWIGLTDLGRKDFLFFYIRLLNISVSLFSAVNGKMYIKFSLNQNIYVIYK
jgi:hypothetical protein